MIELKPGDVVEVQDPNQRGYNRALVKKVRANYIGIECILLKFSIPTS